MVQQLCTAGIWCNIQLYAKPISSSLHCMCGGDCSSARPASGATYSSARPASGTAYSSARPASSQHAALRGRHRRQPHRMRSLQQRLLAAKPASVRQLCTASIWYNIQLCTASTWYNIQLCTAGIERGRMTLLDQRQLQLMVAPGQRPVLMAVLQEQHLRRTLVDAQCRAHMEVLRRAAPPGYGAARPASAYGRPAYGSPRARTFVEPPPPEFIPL